MRSRNYSRKSAFSRSNMKDTKGVLLAYKNVQFYDLTFVDGIAAIFLYPVKNFLADARWGNFVQTCNEYRFTKIAQRIFVVSAPVIDSVMVPDSQTNPAEGTASVYTNSKQYSLNMLVVGACDLSDPFYGKDEVSPVPSVVGADRKAAMEGLYRIPNVQIGLIQPGVQQSITFSMDSPSNKNAYLEVTGADNMTQPTFQTASKQVWSPSVKVFFDVQQIPSPLLPMKVAVESHMTVQCRGQRFAAAV